MINKRGSNNVNKQEDGQSYIFQSYLVNILLILQPFQCLKKHVIKSQS